MGAQTWSGTTTLASGVTIAGFTSSAVNDAGSAVVAWPERTASGSITLRAAVRLAGGAWQPSSVITTTGGNPVAAMAPNGNALVLWNPAGSPGVVQASWYVSGAWSAPANVTTAGPTAPVYRAAFDGQNVATVVVSEVAPGFACALSATTGTAANGFGPTVPVSLPQDCATTPSLAVNAGGEALLGYLAAVGQGGGIVVVGRNASGAWLSGKVLAAAAYRQYGPAVALASNGVAAAVWRMSFGVGRATRSVAGVWSAATSMDTQYQPTDIDMAMDAAGNGIATWTTWTYTPRGAMVYPIRSAKVSATGNWAAPKWLSGSSEDTWENHISASAGGTFLATYASASPYNFKAVTISSGGTTSKDTLSSYGSWSSSASAQGNAVAAWVDMNTYSKVLVRTAVMP